MTRKLRYSERKQEAEEGSLGDLVHDSVPETLRVAAGSAIASAPTRAARVFHRALNQAAVEHFGRTDPWQKLVVTLEVDDFLDFIEIACEASTVEYIGGGTRGPRYPELEAKFNNLMERHRFGYRIEGGDARKLGSPALDIDVVGPALLAVKRPGWEEAEREFQKALDHQRGGQVDRALTAANAAVEAALKAAGMSGSTLGSLAKSFKTSSLVPGYLADVPEILEDLLGKLMAARSTHGDAHGKAPGTPPGEQALADLAVYWAGAFIAYLADIAP